MAEIKLLVACHQPFFVPEHRLLSPIQVGAALAEEHFERFLYDDAGENISEKNRSYCELTAQYWAWKNVDADYYGVFHYRRYLYPDYKERRPYRIKGEVKSIVLERLGFDRMAHLIPEYDLIAPKAENMYVPVREHYAEAPFHYKKDLELVETIVREQHPEMTQAMEGYLSGSMCYFGNIYIMSKAVFHEYCAWLFPILEEFDRRADLSGYSPQELRVDGYLAERLFGIYYTYCKDMLKTLELPRVHFVPDRWQRWKQKLTCILLPPGSKRRSVIKGWKRR